MERSEYAVTSKKNKYYVLLIVLWAIVIGLLANFLITRSKRADAYFAYQEKAMELMQITEQLAGSYDTSMSYDELRLHYLDMLMPKDAYYDYINYLSYSEKEAHKHQQKLLRESSEELFRKEFDYPQYWDAYYVFKFPNHSEYMKAHSADNSYWFDDGEGLASDANFPAYCIAVVVMLIVTTPYLLKIGEIIEFDGETVRYKSTFGSEQQLHVKGIQGVKNFGVSGVKIWGLGVTIKATMLKNRNEVRDKIDFVRNTWDSEKSA